MASSGIPAHPTANTVLQLLHKLSDPDPDFRFMSLNDLLQVLEISKPDILYHDYNTASRAVDGLLLALDDQNGEVQNLAVKWQVPCSGNPTELPSQTFPIGTGLLLTCFFFASLGPLVTKLPPQVLTPLLEKLTVLKLKNTVDKSLPGLALRTVILSLPHPPQDGSPGSTAATAFLAIQRIILPKFLAASPRQGPTSRSDPQQAQMPDYLVDKNYEITPEAIDIVMEIIRCFGPLLQPIEIEALQAFLGIKLESEKGSSVMRKRAVVAMSILAPYLSSQLLARLANRIVAVSRDPKASHVTKRLYIAIMGSLARSIPIRFGEHLPALTPLIFDTLSEKELRAHLDAISNGDDFATDFDDVCEVALTTLEAFLSACPQEMKPFTDNSIETCLRYLKYDPNYAVDDDDEMEDEEEEDGDEDDEDDDAEEFQDDDDDDGSWKVRRCAGRTLYTLISTRGSGDLLESGTLYEKAAPVLIRQFSEREENVRLEVISVMSLLIRKTGEGLYISEPSDGADIDVPGQLPASRKRRRQSSVGGSSTRSQFMSSPGLVSPVLEKAPPLIGPRADLAGLTERIVTSATKQLKGKVIPTKQAIVGLLDDLVLVQRGGLSNYLDSIIGPVLDCMSSSSVGSMTSSLAAASGNASATPTSLRVAALKLMSDISNTHSSTLLHPYLSKIVAAVIDAVGDRFYRISSEAVRTVEELVKAITPPRSRLTAQKYKGELQMLFDVLMDRAKSTTADAEVRHRAIHALGVLLSRTLTPDGAPLISPEDRQQALNVLLDRLGNETSRLSAAKAIDMVAALSSSGAQLDKAWTQAVVLELSTQFRKAKLALRTASIQAIKHLVMSPACKGQLESVTIKTLTEALLPVVKAADASLLGPAILILAALVQEDAELVATPQLTTTLCELLMTRSAPVVLDQLLALVTNIGRSGRGASLMHGLLQDVGTKGDPSVLGQVIGTLLVASGSSANVSLQQFVDELESGKNSKDDIRICLALSILGETGMRLGAASPLKPDLFLRQFRAEPDKVSLAAAVALGRAGSANVGEYLPVILSTMGSSNSSQYLLVQSIKEVLLRTTSFTTHLELYADAIWNQLLKSAASVDNRVVCAECIGRLVVIDPKTFMPRLQSLLNNESSSVRGMAVQAVRYTLPDSDPAFDHILKNVLVGMLLTMLQDNDMDIRRFAMTTLNSAANYKPDLILPHLGELMPFVIKESIIKQELIKEVMMGPFKHRVDGGLEVRKNAYETLYALMETAFTRINTVDLYDRVIAGLKDDNDIRSLCNLMVSKLAVMDPDETTRRLDSIAEAYRAILSTKLKEGAVKQEVEKQAEANKSVLRVTLLLGGKLLVTEGATSGKATASVANQAWSSYWEWANKEYGKELRFLKEENRNLHI